MHDFLGLPLEVDDYIFGGPNNRLYIIVEPAADGWAFIRELDGRLTRKVYLNDYVRISKEQLTIYFMQKGYKT